MKRRLLDQGSVLSVQPKEKQALHISQGMAE